jgi:hypothetical protein
MEAAGILAAVISGIAVVIALAAFVWAAREDGRAQRRRDWRKGS